MVFRATRLDGVLRWFVYIEKQKKRRRVLPRTEPWDPLGNEKHTKETEGATFEVGENQEGVML